MAPSDPDQQQHFTQFLAVLQWQSCGAIIELLITLSQSLGEERVKPLAIQLAAAKPDELATVDAMAAELIDRDWSEYFLAEMGRTLAKARERTARTELGEWT